MALTDVIFSLGYVHSNVYTPLCTHPSPAHCHPTDDPRPWKDIKTLSDKLSEAKVGHVCAMSTSIKDQEYVAHLADLLPEIVVPAFGYHPWFSHTIAVDRSHKDAEHYMELFRNTSQQDELQVLAAELPPPSALSDLLDTLRHNLQKYPKAILGEVGIDKVFRIPQDPKGFSREPHNHSLGRRDRPLTNFTIPLEHQLHIAKAQISVAIELRRSVSFHSVRAGGATLQILDELQKEFPRNHIKLSRKKQKQAMKEASHLGMPQEVETNSQDSRQACFEDISETSFGMRIHGFTNCVQT